MGVLRSETVRGLCIVGFLIFLDWQTRLITNAVRGADPEVQASLMKVAREMRDELRSDHDVTP